MKVTKANIIKAVEKATGIKPELEKHEGSYYWRGKEASLFCDSCIYVSALNHPNATIEVFVESFKGYVAEFEKSNGEAIGDVVSRIDWTVEFED